MSCLILALIITPASAAGEDDEDPSTWTPIQIPGRQRAPEFADITAWINSAPLKMSDQKGKVVVVHFLAFG
jgi:hypothetical protein